MSAWALIPSVTCGWRWAGSRHGRLKRNLIGKYGVRKIDNGGEKLRTTRILTVAAFSIQLASGGWQQMALIPSVD